MALNVNYDESSYYLVPSYSSVPGGNSAMLLGIAQRAIIKRIPFGNCYRSGSVVDAGKAQLKSINKLLDQYSKLYYNSSESPVSDVEYDALIKEKNRLEALYPSEVAALPIGSLPIVSNSNENKIFKHEIPMLSLDNCFGLDDMNSFVNKPCDSNGERGGNYPLYKFIVEPKIDGISLSLKYRYDAESLSYQLEKAGTRGNGVIGVDVTTNVMEMVSDIPHSIVLSSQELNAFFPGRVQKEEFLIEIRGEVYMSTRNFTQLNQKRVQLGLKPLSTARNAAAGAMMIDMSTAAGVESGNSRNLNFFAYQLLTPTSSSESVDFNMEATHDSQWHCLIYLQKMGFPVAYPYFIAVEGVGAGSANAKMNSKLNRHSNIAGYHACINSTWNGSDADADAGVAVYKFDCMDGEILCTHVTDALSTSKSVAFTNKYFAEVNARLRGIWSACQELEFYHRNSLHISETDTDTMSGTKPQFKTPSSNFPSLSYGTDGAVIKYNLFGDQVQLGVSGRSPKWAMAYKYPAASGITTLERIDIQVGRTGVLTPVAVLTPLMLNGVEIKRASLHNEQEINRLGLSVGCSVLVERSGDVIPQVVKRVEIGHTLGFETGSKPKNGDDMGEFVQEAEYQLPDSCPVCGSPVVADNSQSGMGVAKRCTGGFKCIVQLVHHIE